MTSCGAVDVLGGVERLGDIATHSPQPSASSADDADEQDVALGLGAERRPERRDQRHADAPQLDCLDLHRVRTSQPSRVIASARYPSSSALPTAIANRFAPRIAR